MKSFILFAIIASYVLGHSPHDEEQKHDHDCGHVEEIEDYDTAIHIAAAFAVFGASICGSLLPILSSRLSCMRGSGRLLELLNSFGFGVVLATAFIHMIPPAIEILNHPCLNVGYSGLGMVIVAATVLFMQFMETELVLFMTRQQSTKEGLAPEGDSIAIMMTNKSNRGIYERGSTPSLAPIEAAPHHHHHQHGQQVQNSDVRKKINILIFEIGVAIHSVIIGVNLGVSTGGNFTTLLVAICFHQFFEGVAVGTSAVAAFSSLRSCLITSLSYSLSTPIGTSIGILANSSYSDTSVTSLWVRGVLDAIAGGILVYTGIVELLTYKYTINQDFHDKSNTMRCFNYIFLWIGAAAMGVVGIWT